MAQLTVLQIKTTKNDFPKAAPVKQGRRMLVTIANFLRALAGGVRFWLELQVRQNAVQATATVTCAGVLAADTVTVNGRIFTAVTGAAVAEQFDRSGTDAQTAANLAAAINASAQTRVTGVIEASAAAAVVSLTCAQAGLVGNQCTLASSNGGRLAVSGANFAGGANDAVVKHSP